MRIALIVLSGALAVAVTFSGALKLSHRLAVVESYRTAGVPESWLNRLAALLLTAAVALIIGLWWTIAGIAAAAGLCIYFVLAIGFHVRANDTAHVAMPAALGCLAAAVVALHIALL